MLQATRIIYWSFHSWPGTILASVSLLVIYPLNLLAVLTLCTFLIVIIDSSHRSARYFDLAPIHVDYYPLQTFLLPSPLSCYLAYIFISIRPEYKLPTNYFGPSSLFASLSFQLNFVVIVLPVSITRFLVLFQIVPKYPWYLTDQLYFAFWSSLLSYLFNRFIRSIVTYSTAPISTAKFLNTCSCISQD